MFGKAIWAFSSCVFGLSVLGASGCDLHKQESEDSEEVASANNSAKGPTREDLHAELKRACKKVVASGCFDVDVHAERGRVRHEREEACERVLEFKVKTLHEEAEEGEDEEEEERAASQGGAGQARADSSKERHEEEVLLERIAIAKEMADCIVATSDCSEQAKCTQQIVRMPWLAVDGGSLPPDANLGSPEPPWKTPWEGTGGNHLWNGPPWDGGIAPVTGIDSVACTQCAVQRCPTTAFLCFGASGNPNHCAGGDCCQTLRECVLDCGGYREGASAAEYYACLDRCSADKPQGLQQLSNLQHCASVACSGCASRDHVVVTETDGGPRRILGKASDKPLTPILECVTKFASKEYTASFGYQNDAPATVGIPVGPDNAFGPGPGDRVQPTTFQPGRHRKVFEVSFDGTEITWSLNGRTAKASSRSRVCN